jgi:hypothetical protein
MISGDCCSTKQSEQCWGATHDGKTDERLSPASLDSTGTVCPGAVRLPEENPRPKGETASGTDAPESRYPEGFPASGSGFDVPSPPYLLGGDNCQESKTAIEGGSVGIDWIQGTVPIEKLPALHDYISKMCGCRPEVLQWGQMRYDAHCVWHPFGIKLFWDTTPAKQVGHCNRATLQLSGSPLGCFSPEQIFSFVKTLHSTFEFSATRTDLCFDDFKKIMRPHEVAEEAAKGNFTGFKRWEPKQARRVSGEYLSDGVGFGLRGKNGSGRYLRCYDKELESEGEIDAIRWEVEFTKDRAKCVFITLAKSKNMQEFVGSIAALIGGSIDFVDRKGAHLDRMNRLDWWQGILELLGRVTVRSKTPAKTIESSIQWVEKSVASTLLKLEKAIGERPFKRWMDRLRENAPLNKEQEAQVRVYRIQKSLPRVGIL